MTTAHSTSTPALSGAIKSTAGLFCFVLGALIALPVAGAPCREANEIISNNMRLLAGNGDTVWVGTLGSQGWGINQTVDKGESWSGYFLTCLESDLAALAFGQRTLLAIGYPNSDRTVTPIWTYSHTTRTTGSFQIQWHDSTMQSDTIETNAVQGVFAQNHFYFACRHGGIVRWDSKSGSLMAALPGDPVVFDPAANFRATHPRFAQAASTVYALDRCVTDSGTKILAITGPRLWLCDTGLTAWDSTVSTGFADSSLTFKSFVYAFVNNATRSSRPLLYAAIRYSRAAAPDMVSLFRYRFNTAKWTMALPEAPRGITGATRGYFYAIFGKNQITAYRDSLADTASIAATGLTQAITDETLVRRLTLNRNLEKPDSLQDLLFLPTTDSSGNLFIAATDNIYPANGLYSSYGEIPGISVSDFRLDRRAREIKPGLAETFAKPGIISDNYSFNGKTGQCQFIYRLDRDARVTIKIYDYSMRHVKTIIDNEPRKAKPTGRSTDELRDVWDATTTYGKTVAPGLYYYKITTNNGERAFGKIVVAKGR